MMPSFASSLVSCKPPLLLFICRLVVYVNNERRVTGLKVNDGLWHHVVVCWTSVQGMWQIFLDGVLVNSGSLLAADTAISGDVPYILYSHYTISGNAPYIPIYLPYDVG